MTALVVPTLDLYDSWAEAVGEYEPGQMHGSGIPGNRCGAPTREVCAGLVAKAKEYADPARPLPEGKVHCDFLWIVDQAGTFVGFLALRHTLNGYLRRLGGHIGYSVRPSRRREGHASRALALGLDRARRRGLDAVMLTCDDDNLASARTIEGNDGVLQDVLVSHPDNPRPYRRYWISL